MKAVIVEAFGPFENGRFASWPTCTVTDPLKGEGEPRIAVFTGQSKIIFTTHV